MVNLLEYIYPDYYKDFIYIYIYISAKKSCMQKPRRIYMTL